MYNGHMPYFLLMYDVVDDYTEARAKYREPWHVAIGADEPAQMPSS
ncbi:MAG TPA: hypothetical protein VIJ77_05010 [Candidatus Tumulicola sp.]